MSRDCSFPARLPKFDLSLLIESRRLYFLVKMQKRIEAIVYIGKFFSMFRIEIHLSDEWISLI